MDFYLTSKTTGRKIHFPMNPERVSVSTGTNMKSFEVIDLGEIKFPRGKVPASISWEGKLPGEKRSTMSFVKDWFPVVELVDILQEFRDQQDRLQLLITETSINTEVYLSVFEHNWSGGFGDCDYRLELVQARDLKVYTDAEWKQQSAVYSVSHSRIISRPAPVKPKTYTVQPGDTLSKIAKKFLGSATNWPTIYNEPTNRKTIGPDPNKIKVGQVLNIPPGGGTK